MMMQHTQSVIFANVNVHGAGVGVSSHTHISSECEPANISAAYDLRPSHPNRAVHCQPQVSFAHIGPLCGDMQPLLTKQINVTTSGGSQTQCRMRKMVNLMTDCSPNKLML